MGNGVAALLDRAAIHDLLRRYARGVDRRDLGLVASCFTGDAAYEGTLLRGTIDQALARLAEAFPRYRATMHFMGNQTVTLDGDRAQSETYTIAYHRLADETPVRDLTVAVRYLDGLERTSDGWRICRRVVRLDWQRTDVVKTPHD